MNQSNPAGEPDPSRKPQSPLARVHTPGDFLPSFKLTPRPDAEIQAELRRREEQWRRGRVEELQSQCNAPKRQWMRTCLDRSGLWGETEKKLKSRLGSEEGLFVALIGVQGVGKTQLAVEAIRYATGGLLMTARYVTAAAFGLETTPNYNVSECAEDVIERYRKPRLLVMDDYQWGGEGERERRLRNELLDKRYCAKKDTILIAAQGRKDFINKIGPSLASRMSETGAIIDCDGPIFRKPPAETQ